MTFAQFVNQLVNSYSAEHGLPKATVRANLNEEGRKRSFNAAQRRAIFAKSRGRCANPDSNPNCHIRLNPHNWHADHIWPHAAGGLTIIENGQALCPPCNLRKGSDMA
jgi:5-methylcytosine-specific restriction endonuclease McrA